MSRPSCYRQALSDGNSIVEWPVLVCRRHECQLPLGRLAATLGPSARAVPTGVPYAPGLANWARPTAAEYLPYDLDLFLRRAK